MKIKIPKNFELLLNSDKFFNKIDSLHENASSTHPEDNIPIMVAECKREDMKVTILSKNVIKTLKHLKPEKFDRKDLMLGEIPEALTIVAGDKMYMIYQTLIDDAKLADKDLYYVYSIGKEIFSEDNMGAGLISLNPTINMSGSTIEDEDYEILTAALVYLFYGNITTKVYKPKSKCKINAYTSFVNNLDVKLHYVDTTWKQRINTSGFPVKGHFRLQPYKLKKSKLIWIEAFMKKGYNRKAGAELAEL